ncbi:AAA domain-containing protein [Cyanobium sp. NIES-981]|uniref:AAA domain-containing protein n=1 Tax=Cyanobium sp. NIES-981 TaxID=1851505 RepID=UPI0007DD8554|nr:AAA domain-containing protein [Cyanobium sp. NIES-981]SBO44249.1 protein of unknown function [Cyanobium sp. NIES-981]
MSLVEQFQAWADQLVDLSGRNDLISFRQTKTSTLTLSPEAAARLQRGQWCLVRDLFDLVEKGNRSLIRRVLTIAEDNAEQLGVETLTFISGFAEWSAEKITRPQAPFLLMDVKVRGAGSNLDRWEIALDTEASEINPVLLQYLRGVAGLKVSDEALDEALDTSPEAVQELLSAAAPAELGLHFTSGLFIKNLTYQKLPMVEDLRRATDALSNHKVIASLAGDQNATASLQKLTASCPRTAPNHTPSREEFLILDADASQHWAINTALEGQNLVIEGPPGTGKSQTIANLIGAFMARGKSVLFVAEKRAAIDAVKKRIDKAGLGELLLDLHDSSVLRARPAQPFAQALEALAQVPDVDLEPAHQSLDVVRERLLAHSEALHATREPWRCSYHEVATMLLSSGTLDPEPLRLTQSELQGIDRAGILRISQLINNLGTLPSAQVLKPSWIFCVAVRSGALADAQIVQELLDRADALKPSVRQLNDWLEHASPRLRNREALTLSAASTITSQLGELLGPCAAAVDVYRLLSLPPAERSNLADQLAKGYKAGLLGGLFNRERKSAIDQARNLSRNGDLFQVERALELIRQLEAPMVRIGEIPGSGALMKAIDAITAHLQWLSARGVVSIPEAASINSLLALLEATQDSRRLLIKAPAIAQRLNELEAAGASREGLLQQVADRLSQGMSSEKLARSARRGWALQVEEKISLLDPRLTEATRRNLDSLVRRFRETDRKVIAAKPLKIRRLVAERAHAIRLQPEGQKQERLIRGEALKRRRKGRLSARRLFEAAPDLLTALKPCWAMSPLVVSQNCRPIGSTLM